jgi:hypothetical protein
MHQRPPPEHAIVILGHVLFPHDDDSYMLGPDTYRAPAGSGFMDWRFGVGGVPHPATCPTCGRKLNPSFVSETYRVKKRRRDATCTYDGYILVSKRFREQCELAGWPGVEFVALPADGDFFWLRSPRVIRFDAEAAGVRFEDYCKTCGGWCSVVGATPVRLRGAPQSLSEGFFRTDLEFGSGHEQCPLILVGPATGRAIAARRYSLLDVEPIEA